MGAVFALFLWLSITFYRTTKQAKAEYEREILGLRPRLEELGERQRQTSEAFDRFLGLLEAQYGQLSSPERHPELPAAKLDALPGTPQPGFLQGLDPDIPLSLGGGTLIQVTYMGDKRVARYAFPSPGAPGGQIYRDIVIGGEQPTQT